MAAAIIDEDTALDTVLEHSIYTLTRLSAHALTADLAQGFVAFQQAWAAVNAQELALRIDLLKAGALVVASDDELDVLVDAVSNVLLSITGKDRDAAIYKLYFGDKRPSELKRPVLGDQLEAMRAWSSTLKSAKNPALSALGDGVEQKVAAADAAKDAMAAAQHARRVFRTTGERRALIDQFNALRKSTYGKLAELPNTQPNKNLPGSFAEQFFKRVSRAKEPVEALTSTDLREQLDESERQVEALRDRVKEALAREDEAAKAALAMLAIKSRFA